MNSDADARYLRMSELLPFQAEFVEKFTQPGSAAHHLLIAPTGSGKTAVIGHIVKLVLETGNGKRILILGPRPVIEQQAYLFRTMTDGGLAQVVDRYRYRELEADAPVDRPPWPESIVAFMSIDFAKQDDIADSLSCVPWDLVVVDESHLLSGRRADLLRRLVESRSVKRLLMTTATPAEPHAWLPEHTTTDWRARVATMLKGLGVPLRKETVTFSYTHEEAAVFEHLRELRTHPDRIALPPTLQHTLLRCARSSFYALEKSLLRLRNRLAHGRQPPALDADIDLDEQALFEQGYPELPDPTAALAVVEGLLAALAEVGRDSKLDALDGLLRGLGGSRPALVTAVFTRYAATADYLHFALADRGLEAAEVTGAIPVADRGQLLGQVFESGGILIATEAATRGFDLRPVRSCVIYDVPSSPEILERTIARMWRPGRNEPLDVFLFDDTSQTDLGDLLAQFESGGDA